MGEWPENCRAIVLNCSGGQEAGSGRIKEDVPPIGYVIVGMITRKEKARVNEALRAKKLKAA